MVNDFKNQVKYSNHKNLVRSTRYPELTIVLSGPVIITIYIIGHVKYGENTRIPTADLTNL